MKKLKIIFMGTTDFGVPALEKLVAFGHEILAVIAQPDRVNQRGKKITILPLKEKAIELGIEVLQPENIKDPAFIEQLRSYAADIFIVAAYGQLLSKEILTLPFYGSLNLHGSLLPKYRGAAPIQRAIIDGEKKTGVTIMKMDVGMDTGDMLSKVEVLIGERTFFGSLYKVLAEAGGELLIKTIDALIKGKIKAVPQNEQQATQAPKISKETGRLNWNLSGECLSALINGTDPQPGAYFMEGNQKIKCFNPQVIPYQGNEKSGTILKANEKEGLLIKTGNGALKLLEIQYPGKKRMETKVFFRGNSLEVGKILKEN